MLNDFKGIKMKVMFQTVRLKNVLKLLKYAIGTYLNILQFNFDF